MAEGAVTCSSCATSAAQSVGGGTAVAPAATPSAGGLTDNVAGLLAYLLIPAVIFLIIEPYNRNRFVRFHSFQSIFYCIAGIAIGVIMGILTNLPFLGIVMALFLGPVIGFGLFIVWVILLIKAYQGQMFKLPFIGEIAEKQAQG